MTYAQSATQRYSSFGAQTRSAKDLEYDVFLKVTRDLSNYAAQATENFPKLAKILNQNERLWLEIGVQVADPNNQLDRALRARLFYLAQFVSHQTTKVLKGSADLQTLIELNFSILRGLKGNE